MRTSILASLLLCWAPGGQDVQPPKLEEVQTRLQQLAEQGDGADPAAVDAYQQAAASLKRAAEHRADAQRFATDAAEAPSMLESLRTELSQPPAEPELPDPDRLNLEDLETQLGQSQADLDAARGQVDELTKLAEFRASRTSELAREIAEAQQAYDAARETLDATPPAAENEARRVQLLAQLEELGAKRGALDSERSTYEARREVLPLRRDRALRREAEAERVVEHWQQAVDARRAQEGEAAASRAELQLEQVEQRFPKLQEVAKETRELTARRSGEDGLPKRISRAQTALAKMRALDEDVARRFRAARRRIAAGGLTEGMGAILRRDYEWLQREADLRAQKADIDQDLSRAQLELISIEEDRFQVGDLESELKDLLAKLELPADAVERAELAATARELLAAQREARRKVLDDLQTLTQVYYTTKEQANLLLEHAQGYEDLIEKRILWVRSTSLNPLPSLVSLPAHFAEIVLALTGADGRNALLRAVQEGLSSAIPLTLFLLVVLAGRRYLREKRAEMAGLVRSYRTDKFVFTVRAMIQTLLLALPLPLFAWIVGELLRNSPEQVLAAIGGGLRSIAKSWLVLRFLRGLMADKGVGGAHFKWPAAGLATVRRELTWFEPIGVLFGLVFLSLDQLGRARWTDSIGRACFVTVMVALAVFSHRLLREESDLWAPTMKKSLLGRTHRVWSLLATGIPLALVVLALLGFTYTALQLELRLRYSIGFALALVLLNALLLRWLFITRRRLAVTQALEAKARREEEGAAGSDAAATPLDADKVDIPAVDAKTRQLFQSSITLGTVIGLWFIWASVLPALQGLDRVQILPRLAITAVEEEPSADEAGTTVATDASGAATSGASTGAAAGGSSAAAARTPLPLPTKPDDAPAEGADTGSESVLGLPSTLTLADVMLALIFLLLTSVAAKNLPALLEISLLQRLPLDGGARYAVSTIVRYLVVLIGVSAISGALGVGWRQIQWLAAALTFGLAFGLQEIFANFVSGIIILVERPVRVGDIVTVAGTEGRVTRLRMRATTIQDWDRRELIVPNKEFITGSVVNWTLTDSVTRVVIPVGVAYGSDTRKTHDLLLKVAKQCPWVMEDPKPVAIFRSFGDSTLDFELRVFLENRDSWPDLVDGLHTQIDDAFRKAGIEIAFPQRDLHIRSVPPEMLRPEREDGPSGRA